MAYLHHPPALLIIQLDYFGSTPSTRITRRQFPLSPVYAFTDFKSQGQTIEHVSVDIGKTTFFKLSPFNAYVALSRSRSRKTTRPLRDFDNVLFLQYPSEDLCTEDQQIDAIVEETKKRYDDGQYGQLHQPTCLFHHPVAFCSTT
ncbi:hypothetical protein M405DRAFT_934534 [Rhizopogon salebrosus TDB-379]|nr:hypothetical protein M405DRAFT_934534 [Rhizopogon salebrosus TDB-379]